MILIEKYREWEGRFGNIEFAYNFAGIFTSMEEIPEEIKNAKIYSSDDNEEISLYRFKEVELNKLI